MFRTFILCDEQYIYINFKNKLLQIYALGPKLSVTLTNNYHTHVFLVP